MLVDAVVRKWIGGRKKTSAGADTDNEIEYLKFFLMEGQAQLGLQIHERLKHDRGF